MNERKTIDNVLECDPACLTAQEIAERYGFHLDCDCINIEVKDLDRLFADPAGCEFAQIVAKKNGITIHCPEVDPQKIDSIDLNRILECSEECLKSKEVAERFGINLDCDCLDIKVEDLDRLFQEPAGCELASIIASKHGVEILCPEEA